MRAAARATDPWTAWAAARSIPDLRPRLAAVLHAFCRFGPMTLEEVTARYLRYGVELTYPAQTEQSVRSRTAELVRLGHLEDTGDTRLTVNGRKARVLRVPGPPVAAPEPPPRVLVPEPAPHPDALF